VSKIESLHQQAENRKIAPAVCISQGGGKNCTSWTKALILVWIKDDSFKAESSSKRVAQRPLAEFRGGTRVPGRRPPAEETAHMGVRHLHHRALTILPT